MNNKYHNKKVVVDNQRFDSKKEYRRWQNLCLLEKGHVISDLRRQVRYNFTMPDGNALRYPSGRMVTYAADFVYVENGREIVEDVKGLKTDVYKLKAALMLAFHHIKILET